MCYPKPGPRCSPHARKKLQKAQDDVKNYAGDDNARKEELKEALLKAQKEYFLSPEGIKSLRSKAIYTGNKKYTKQADTFEQKRKEMIAEYKKQADTPMKPDTSNTTKQDETDYPDVVPVTKWRQPTEWMRPSVDYDYDSYGCSGRTCDRDGYDDYCRDAEYEGLRIDEGSINPRVVLARMFSVEPQDIPDDLVLRAENELDLDDPESYEVYAEPGYYGDEAHVEFAEPTKVREALNRYYYELPDANDENGVLPYVRGKGMDTTGLTPVEALKKQLREENGGRRVSYVENATKVESGHVSFDKILMQDKHYQEVEPRKPMAPQNAKTVCGVLVKVDDTYRLVDGYHRVKSQAMTNLKKGNFLILSQEK